jgi:alkylation response protein AidB-like acyl-CoA dehydrogenase
VQEALARAEVALESARAYRSEVLNDVWRSLEAGEPLSIGQRARVRLAGANAADSAVRAVDLMYSAGGTTSIEEDFPLSRIFRDVHVIAQHVTVGPVYYEYIGKALLGIDLDGNRPF